ncbi:MAG: S41 family peptidase [Tannerella sp.]|jgi:carboxyl-terminal processing protease|nr:S41 family peptidase [Tannerella sp.]
MSNNNYKRTELLVPITIAVIISIACGFYAGAYLFKNHQYGGNKIDAILDIIDQQYVDTVNVDQLINNTAQKLVNELDPHSVLIPTEDRQIVADELEGSFSGIGVSFETPSDTILVINVISRGPAEKAGILSFDRIITIDDSIYAGKSISPYQIRQTLRGSKNSKVKLGIQRGNSPELIDFNVTRGDVPNYSIDVFYTLDNDIGYIKVKNFARTTYNEFITAIAKLKKDGCSSFVIDLRGNSGGYLDAAIRVINEFMPAHQSIVYTEGKAFKRQNFYADGTGTCQNVPLVILTDELSGSASEIFAGAIQDNDRGLIIGRRSYGKGLVQAPIPLEDGSELRLTIARYYTPSGRCIQKTYDMGKSEEYDQDLYNRYLHGEFDSADSIKMDDSVIYTTIGGRTVYGGGGIMPDIFIPRDTANITSYYSSVINTGVLHQFALEYSDHNHEKLESFKTYEELYAYLQQQSLLNEFADFAEGKGIKKRPTLIQISGNMIETLLSAYIVRNFFDLAGFYPIFQKDDVTIHRAVQAIRNGTCFPEVS